MEKFALERPMEAETIRAVIFRACKADELHVSMPKSLEKKLFFLRSPRNAELLENSLAEQLGTKFNLVYFLDEGSKASEAAPTAATPATSAIPGKPTPPPPNLSQEAFLADPVIQNALKILEAKIVTPAGK